MYNSLDVECCSCVLQQPLSSSSQYKFSYQTMNIVIIAFHSHLKPFFLLSHVCPKFIKFHAEFLYTLQCICLLSKILLIVNQIFFQCSSPELIVHAVTISIFSETWKTRDSKKSNFVWQAITVFGLLKIFTVFKILCFTTLISDRERKGSTVVLSGICSAISVSVC
jgi:membrane-associated HD superfamily phosphohydrolase